MISARATIALAFALLVALPSGACRDARPPSPTDSERLRAAVTPVGVMEHVRRLDEIAQQHGGNRASGSPGYDASADYVAARLRDAGYEVTVQRFGLPFSPTRSGSRETANVIADRNGGREGETVVIGAHLDSVPEGPGINDNGSGVAAILEIAEEMGELDIEARNNVRFAFWGAEEIGLLGSTHYVESLSRREIQDIPVYLNFDMLGSPNGTRFVYDDRGNPRGSARVEDAFAGYFESQNLASEPDDTLVGRSDHGPFADRGIPVGGLFSGAEGIKTAKEAESYGGESGEPHDPCYHEACDTAQNLDVRLLEEMSDAAAHAVSRFATQR